VQAVTERFETEGLTIPYPHRAIEGELDGPGSRAATSPGD
jgi:small-conductance mechanosensitive channel